MILMSQLQLSWHQFEAYNYIFRWTLQSLSNWISKIDLSQSMTKPTKWLVCPVKTRDQPARCPGWSESSVGALLILLFLSCGGSFEFIDHLSWFSQCIYQDRKVIIKSLKTNVVKACKEEYGHMVLLSIFDCVDDTKIVRSIVLDVSQFTILQKSLSLKTIFWENVDRGTS